MEDKNVYINAKPERSKRPAVYIITNIFLYIAIINLVVAAGSLALGVDCWKPNSGCDEVRNVAGLVMLLSPLFICIGAVFLVIYGILRVAFRRRISEYRADRLKKSPGKAERIIVGSAKILLVGFVLLCIIGAFASE